MMAKDASGGHGRGRDGSGGQRGGPGPRSGGGRKK
jgi:hypothetical protein